MFWIYATIVGLVVACVALQVQVYVLRAEHRAFVSQVQWIVDHGGPGMRPDPEAEANGDLLWQESADWVRHSRANRGW